MTDDKAVLKEIFNDLNSSCCSDTSCCGPQAPAKRLSSKVGRNDPCPCESGKKFKKCCGLNS